jgi:hypothetical protein
MEMVVSFNENADNDKFVKEDGGSSKDDKKSEENDEEFTFYHESRMEMS